VPVAGELSRAEAETILQQVLGLSRSELYLQRQSPVAAHRRAAIDAFVKKRLTGMPLAYALGRVYFHSQEFKVTPAVLIPRPDTEILVETVLRFEPPAPRRFVDVGTGSGVIVQTLLSLRPGWRAAGVDISPAACRVARENCESAGAIVCGDRLLAFKPRPGVDFIVSNPPYIAARDRESIDKSVTAWEPAPALWGGEDGLDFYRYLADQGRLYLTAAGRIYCEIGFDQAETVTDIFSRQGWRECAVFNDLAGRSRVFRAVCPA
jgi:release factor glutamine methyltransferase